MSLLETLTSAGERASEARGWLVSDHAARFLTGTQETEELEDGWVRPWRFSSVERQALSSCLAWHPGRYRQLAATTAGVCLRMVTDASEVAFSVRPDGLSSAARMALRVCGTELGQRQEMGPTFAAASDGEPLTVEYGVPHTRALEWLGGAEGTRLVSVSLDDEVGPGGIKTMVLPGLGVRRELEVWLPFERGCILRDVWCDGTYLEPLPPRERLVVLGDDMAQGFGAPDAAHTWPALLAQSLGLELANLSLAGQVFQPSMLVDLDLGGVRHVVVSLGAHYAHERVAPSEATRDARSFVAELQRRMDGSACLEVVTPETGTAEVGGRPQPLTRAFWRETEELLRARAAVGAADVRLTDAARLEDADAQAADPRADLREAHALVARRLEIVMRGAPARELRARAQAILAGWGTNALPMAAAIGEGHAEVLYAAPTCVLARVRDGSQLVCATDADILADAATLSLTGTTTVLLGPSEEREELRALEKVLAARLGLSHRTCAYLVTCTADGALDGVEGTEGGAEVPGEVVPLDETHEEAVWSHLRHPERLGHALLRQLLAEGAFLGAFEGERLVGFVGEQPDGSIGLLEVFRRFRRQGFGRALELAKISRLTGEGRVVRMLVNPRSTSALALQRQLSLEVSERAHVVVLSP